MYLSLLAATGVLASAALAAPAQQHVLGGLDLEQLPLSHPDFDLDLAARRLVQFGENEEPVWVTELEKVRMPLSTHRRCAFPYSHDIRQIQAKAEGRKFFDM
jgi:hypothetical protein